ncbi:MAG TPA: OB-fold nucleic acid binding domain-containing protein, partial [Myxococcaceae bacterium]|nr:OB-fold nucleic acid binding domain-containing protein [Myxococcaceae bacterium]
MPESTHPLASLIPPLRYACQRDFARLSTVKDLRGVLGGALEQARGDGVPPRVIAALTEEMDRVDATDPKVRKASLKRIVGSLGAAGLPLPEELARLASEAVEPAPAPRVDVEEEEAISVAPGSRGRAAASEVRSEARLLSIAPREGPLAAPLKSVGGRLNPRLLGALQRRGLRKIGDVLFLLPRCYEDRRRMDTIAALKPGERGVTVGTVVMSGDSPHRGRGARRVFRAILSDGTGTIAATYFQTGPWLKGRFPMGKKLIISGEVRASHAGREMVHPEVEPADDMDSSSVHFNRVVPVYPGFERHEQRTFRDLAFRVSREHAGHLEDPLPGALRKRLGLMELPEALRRIHFPLPTDDLNLLDAHASPAHRRLAFDELFFLQLGVSLKRQ